ncbi:MAG: hypothetical protein Q9169_006571 [Polycauliona sp. 2 TL-2023]
MTNAAELERLNEVVANFTQKLTTLVESQQDTTVGPLLKGFLESTTKTLETEIAKISALVTIAKTGSDEGLDRSRKEVEKQSVELAATQKAVAEEKDNLIKQRRASRAEFEKLTVERVETKKAKQQLDADRQKLKEDVAKEEEDIRVMMYHTNSLEAKVKEEQKRLQEVEHGLKQDLKQNEGQMAALVKDKEFVSSLSSDLKDREAKVLAREEKVSARECEREREVAASGLNKLVNEASQKIRSAAQEAEKQRSVHEEARSKAVASLVKDAKGELSIQQSRGKTALEEISRLAQDSMTSHLGKIVSDVEVASQGIGVQLFSRLDADIAKFEGSTASLTGSLSQMSQDLAGLRGIPATVTGKLEEFATAASSKSQDPSSPTIEEIGQTVKTSVLSAIEETIAKPIESQGLTLNDVAATQQSNFDELVEQINGLSEDEQKRLKEIFIRTDKKLDDIAAQFEPLQLALEDLGANLPSDRQTEWQETSAQLTSIIDKLASLESVGRLASSPQSLGRQTKRPSETSLVERMPTRRKSSQQGPRGEDPPSGRTSPLKTRTDSSAAPAPKLTPEQIWSQIQFEGEDWTDASRDYVMVLLEKLGNEDIANAINICAQKQNCMTTRFRKVHQELNEVDRDALRCHTCIRNDPCIRVDMIDTDADTESSGHRWSLNLRH